MGVRIQIIRDRIYLSICKNKKQWRESTGLTVSTDKGQNREIMKLAEVLRSKREAQMVCAVNGLADNTRGQMLLSQYITDMVKDKMDTAKKQMLKVLPYINKYGADVKINAINRKYVEDVKTQFLREKNLKSENTKSLYFCLFKNAIHCAVREGLLPTDPTDGVQGIKTHDGNRQYLTADEINTLYKTKIKMGRYRDDIRAAFLLAILTGLRISDLRALRWHNINADVPQIVKQQKKTNEYVYIPIQSAVLDAIGYDDGLPKDEFVFPRLAAAADIAHTNRYIKAWAEAAGIRKVVTWHVARHTYATLLIESGADIYTVQRLLGHTNVSTTQKYAKVSDKKKTAAVAALPTFFDRIL